MFCAIALYMGLNDYYERAIVRGVVRFAKQQPDWKLYGYGWMFRPLEALEQWKGDGIIARVESQQDADRLASLDIPVVDVAGAYVWSGFLQVNNDDYATGEKAARYLLSCGFKRFAFCGVENVRWSERRKQGFLDVLKTEHSEIAVFEESLGWWESLENSEHLQEWIQKLTYPAAIFACNDTAGVKLTELCRKLEINVPSEAAILGVDNEDILCEISSPSLSSIELDCERIGFKAATILNGVLKARSVESAQKREMLIPPRDTIERESTKIFACDDVLVEKAVAYIRARATGGIKVTDILEIIPASRRNLENRFKKEVGRTLHEEIIRVRIEYAKALLKNTNMTISHIAGESGFGTVQRFYVIFRQSAGCSPAGYRDRASDGISF